MAEMTSYAIGIDLGTTNSVVGVFRNGKVEIIANDFGNRTTPSIVGFDNFEQLIGDPAKQQMINNPENTIYDCKRMMGKSFANDDLRQNKAIWPFHVIHTMGKPKYIVKFLDERKEFAPEQISSMILLELKQRAEKYLGNPVKYAVITVPAYFNDLQRKATKEAAKIAKLNVLSIINEPTAAAIAYGFENVSNDKRNILIFHLGGGTFDVSILEIEKMNFEVIATGGDIHLGGEDFDNRLVQHFLNEMKLKHNHIDLCKNKRALAKLRQACEGAKKTLAFQTVAKIEVDSLTSGFDFKSTISRALFEELNADLFRSTLVTMEKVLSDADLRSNQIDEIVLVGGSTRIPKIQQIVKNFFNGKEPVKSMNPEEEIAIGAAIEAAKLHESIPQEEIVELKFDVTFFNLGLGIGDDLENMHTMIPRNKKAPATNTAGFLTLYDNQTEIDVKVYLGESSLTAENILIGELRLCDIPPASEQFVEVTFAIDCHGILKVTAFIESTKNELILTIDTTEYLDDGQRKKLIEQSQKRNELERARKALQQKENTPEYLKSARFKLDEILFGEVDDYEIFEIALECAEISNWIIMNENHANKEMFEEKKKHLQNRWYDLFNEELVQLPKPF